MLLQGICEAVPLLDALTHLAEHGLDALGLRLIDDRGEGFGERDARVRSLEEQLRSANQLRQDVAKRIDELIGQIDQLDAELEAAESGVGG